MGIQRYSHHKSAVLTPVRGIGTLIWETDRSGDQRPRWSAEILMPPCLLVVLDRYEDSRKLEEFFLYNACHLRVFVCWTGTSRLACHLRVIPLTDGDVGHYDKEPGESNPLVFDRPFDAEGLNILPSSHEFS